MNSLIPQDPESLVHAADAIGHTIKNVPGLYDAVYETIAHVWIDPIRRRRRAMNLQHELEMAEKMIEGKQRLDDVSAKVAKEVLEPAMEEDREELQKLWAALIARLLTSQLVTIRREWVNIINNLNELDVAVLQVLPGIKYVVAVGGDAHLDAFMREIQMRWPLVSCSNDDILLSQIALKEQGVIERRSNLPGNINQIGATTTTDWHYTLLGRKIIEITTPPE